MYFAKMYVHISGIVYAYTNVYKCVCAYIAIRVHICTYMSIYIIGALLTRKIHYFVTLTL